MKWLPFFIGLLVFYSCQTITKKNKQPEVLVDSGRAEISGYKNSGDSVYWEEKGEWVLQSRKEFLLREPLRIFISDDSADAIDKMITAIIDTMRVISLPYVFSEKVISEYDSMHDRLSKDHVYKGGSYTIRLKADDFFDHSKRRLFINGLELLPGKDIDTSISWSGFPDDIGLDKGDFRIMKFANKEYLYLRGYIEKCNGIGCGYSYHILYDPVIRKAMIIDQFRICDFKLGVDPVTQSPVFMKMEDTELAPPNYAIDEEGKAYLFNRSGKIVPYTSSVKKQYYLKAYARDDNFDTLYVLDGVFPGLH